MVKGQIAQEGPYVQETEAGEYYWCACGRSNHQPFCDGSHKGTECRPVLAKVDKKKSIAWCGCKQTDNPPMPRTSKKPIFRNRPFPQRPSLMRTFII